MHQRYYIPTNRKNKKINIENRTEEEIYIFKIIFKEKFLQQNFLHKLTKKNPLKSFKENPLIIVANKFIIVYTK